MSSFDENKDSTIRCYHCSKYYPLSYFINKINGTQTKACSICREIDNKSHNNPNTIYHKIKSEIENLRYQLPPCVKCGDDDPDHKEFDHIDPEEKICSIHSCISIEQLKEEVSKCQSLCTKCHRKRSWEQSQLLIGKRSSNPRKIRAREYVNQVKLKIGKCQMTDCKDLFDPSNLSFYEFDHLIPLDTDVPVSRLVAGMYGTARIQVEIDKCRLLCRFCHHEHNKKQQIDRHNSNNLLLIPIKREKRKHPKPVSQRPPKTHEKKCTPEQIKTIREQWNSGKFLLKDLSVSYNITSRYVGNIINNMRSYDPTYVKIFKGSRGGKRIKKSI